MPETLRVTWEYRADFDAAKAFSDRYERRKIEEARHVAYGRYKAQKARLEALPQSNEIKRRLEALEAQAAEMGEVEDLSTGDGELEYLADELSSVIKAVIVRKTRIEWPSDREAQIAILREMPPPTVAELREAIYLGLFDVDEVGKS